MEHHWCNKIIPANTGIFIGFQEFERPGKESSLLKCSWLVLEVILKAFRSPRRFEFFRVLIVSTIPFGDRLRRVLIFYIQGSEFLLFRFSVFRISRTAEDCLDVILLSRRITRIVWRPSRIVFALDSISKFIGLARRGNSIGGYSQFSGVVTERNWLRATCISCVGGCIFFAVPPSCWGPLFSCSLSGAEATAITDSNFPVNVLVIAWSHRTPHPAHLLSPLGIFYSDFWSRTVPDLDWWIFPLRNINHFFAECPCG